MTNKNDTDASMDVIYVILRRIVIVTSNKCVYRRYSEPDYQFRGVYEFQWLIMKET